MDAQSRNLGGSQPFLNANLDSGPENADDRYYLALDYGVQQPYEDRAFVAC